MSDSTDSFSSDHAAALSEAAEALASRLADTLQDAAHPTSASVDFQSAKLIGTVKVLDVDHVGEIESKLASSLSVIANHWSSDRAGDTPRRTLECVIPPDVKPHSWKKLADLPRTFLIGIEATLSPEDATTPTLLQLHSHDGPHALVMKGGGIKGLAYVGALEVLCEDCEFCHFIGTSAGAISALLLAAGYTPSELKDILRAKDFREFFDAPWYMKPVNLLLYRGLNHAHTFTDWLDDLLAKKLGSPTRVRMSELPDRATVFASRRDKGALRFDSETDDADAAHAGRCSMSIPLVFVPQSDQGFRTYDGGMQHNYPLDALLQQDPNTPFVSLYLGSATYKPNRNRFEFWEWVSIWTEGSDAELLKRHRDRTVVIDPAPIGTLDFALSDEEKQFLLQCGRAAALAFLESGSERHEAAIAERDRLKKDILPIRTARKRRLWLLRGIRLVLAIAVVGGLYALNEGRLWSWGM